MGDRANVYIIGADVYLYTHWGGYNLARDVQIALSKRERWSDASYLARIVFCELVKSDYGGSTGFGISHYMGDNGNPVIVLDPDKQQIYIQGDAMHAMTFEAFIKLTSDQARAWHLERD